MGLVQPFKTEQILPPPARLSVEGLRHASITNRNPRPTRGRWLFIDRAPLGPPSYDAIATGQPRQARIVRPLFAAAVRL